MSIADAQFERTIDQRELEAAITDEDLPADVRQLAGAREGAFNAFLATASEGANQGRWDREELERLAHVRDGRAAQSLRRFRAPLDAREPRDRSRDLDDIRRGLEGCAVDFATRNEVLRFLLPRIASVRAAT